MGKHRSNTSSEQESPLAIPEGLPEGHSPGLSRKNFLRKTAGFLAGLGLANGAADALAKSLGLTGRLGAEEMPEWDDDPYDIVLPSKVKSVIFINMAGGMSHVDTLDPRSNQSAFGTVNSSIKGIQIGEPFRKTAAQLKHLSMIRQRP